MTRTDRWCACGVVSLALALGGCDPGGSSEGEAGDVTGSSESSSGGASTCVAEADEYLPGMSKQGESMTVVLVESMPAPPTQGDNV
jgi:hypothetical protein